jgi:hypothetical protein
VGDTACTGEIRNAYKILIGKLERLGFLRAVILKFICLWEFDAMWCGR